MRSEALAASHTHPHKCIRCMQTTAHEAGWEAERSNKTKKACGNRRQQAEWKVCRTRLCVLLHQCLIHASLQSTAGCPVCVSSPLQLNQHLVNICVVISLTDYAVIVWSKWNHSEHFVWPRSADWHFSFLLSPPIPPCLPLPLSFLLSLCRLCLFWELVQQPTADQEDRRVEQGECVHACMFKAGFVPLSAARTWK